MSRVLVFGSLNMDLVVETNTFLRLGETLAGASFATHAGGKGANQAVAAARLGANVTMIGRVGADQFGVELKARLAAEGVVTRWVQETPGVSTGIAQITVCNADNAIVVVSGANARLSPADLDEAEAAFAAADVVLAQLEVPLATVEHGAEIADSGRILIDGASGGRVTAAEARRQGQRGGVLRHSGLERRTGSRRGLRIGTRGQAGRETGGEAAG